MLVKSLKAFFDDLSPIVPFVGRWTLSYCAEVAAAIRLLIAQVTGDKKKASMSVILRRLFVFLLYHPVQLLLTSVSLVLNAIASLINNTLLVCEERKLNAAELHYLHAIFADNLDYEIIRIQFGGIKDRLKISPQAVGNDIFLREIWGTRIYYDDFTLTDAGLRLLGHEACHVWQAQHTGSGYIGDSLITQACDFFGRRLNVHLSDGYDVLPVLRSGRNFSSCNVEQQAVIAELIGASCAANETAELKKDQLCKASGLTLNNEEFAGVVQAHHCLQQASKETPLGF